MIADIELQSNGQPKSLNFDDLKMKLGYKTYNPKIGSFGRALIRAAKRNRRSIGWVEKQLDSLFKKKNTAHNKERNFNDKRKK